MTDIHTLGPWLERFLIEHIVTERNLATNTQKSYRDAFKLLLPFVSSKAKKPVDRLAVRDLTTERVLRFLAHIEDDRGCSVQTRNQRLTAIRAFARFVASRDPALVGWCGQVRAIHSKKTKPPSITSLTKTEMDALLAVPDRKTLRGRNEYALLLFLYNTGARVSEATHLKVGDLQVGGRDANHALVTLHGKAARHGNARCDRNPSALWQNWWRDTRLTTLSSLAGFKSRLPGSASIGWLSVAQPACLRWLEEKYRHMC